MRILFVIPKLSSFVSFLSELGAALLDEGIEVHCACSPGSLWNKPDRIDPRVRVHPIPMPRGMNPVAHARAARRLDQVVREIKPDIVHGHFSSALFTTALARRSYWPTTLGTFHGMSFPLMKGFKGAILKFAESTAAARCDSVWVLTEDDCRALAAAARRAHVEVTRSCGIGCDLARFEPVTAMQRTAARGKLGFAADDIVFVFVGRFARFKGFDLTTRAFLRVAADNPRLRLLLVGVVDPLHTTGLTETEELARRDCPRITDVGYQSDVRQFLAASDAMVFPSTREGVAVCLMESLAMGVPAITRDARGCRDVVRDEIDGLVLGNPTVETVGDAMVRLANDPALRQRLAAAAVAGRERFDRRHFIKEQLAIYRQRACVVTPRPGVGHGMNFKHLHPAVIVFCQQYFSELERRGVSYAVLSGLEQPGNDIDYVVARRDLETATEILTKTASAKGWVVAQTIQHDLAACYSVAIDPANPAKHIALDVCVDDTLLEGRERRGDLFVISAAAETAYRETKLRQKRQRRLGRMNLFGRLGRLRQPRGMRITILGPDGAGKSTLLEHLGLSLAPCFRHRRVYKFRPDVFGRIEPGIERHPHAREPRNAVISWAKVIYYFIDWWLGLLFVLWPAQRRNTLVMFDRDFNDLLVDQRRYLVRNSSGLIRCLSWLLPRPDLTIVLDADPQVVHARKPELPVAVLEQQRQQYQRLVSSNHNCRLIQADQPVLEVARAATREIIYLLAAQRRSRIAKRAFDLAVVVPALVVLAPVLAVVALLVRWKLGSPVIFRQQRPGLHGAPFDIFKFRTMTEARDANGKRLPDAQRLTTFGRWLRSTSLDELPELWNVLRGDMSLVGPRPLLMQYLPLYNAEQRRRHDVLPGVTGWAQVNGRNSATWGQKFACDVWYVDHQSLWLDLKIIARTVGAVLNRQGINQPGLKPVYFRGDNADTEWVTSVEPARSLASSENRVGAT